MRRASSRTSRTAPAFTARSAFSASASWWWARRVSPRGDLLATDVNGKAVTATTGNKILGRALATGAAGVIIPALIQQKGKL